MPDAWHCTTLYGTSSSWGPARYDVGLGEAYAARTEDVPRSHRFEYVRQHYIKSWRHRIIVIWNDTNWLMVFPRSKQASSPKAF
jgi:hypothetical protein